MPDIFLSYSRDDQAIARRFAEGFERAGFTVWWDQALNAGQAFDRVTEKALEDASAVVVLWSKRSVDSNWVRAEATQAHASQKLVPVMIEPCKRPIMFELTHTAELAHWKGDAQDPAWQTFLADLTRFVHKEAPVPVQAMPATTVSKRKARLAIAIAGAGVLIAGAAWWASSRVGGSNAPPSNTQVVTLAVLPFADMSPEHDQEYFSDGLTEELLNQLAQVRNLRLTARTSSFSFKGKNEDMRVIGEKLGVRNLLEGSVRKDGKQLRITAQLINAADGAHLWSRTYDRELASVFSVQEEIAKDVARALSIRLDVGEVTRAEGGTNSVEAYDKFLQAAALNRQGIGIELKRKEAQLYRDALALDPNFARAWVGLRGALLNLNLFAKTAATETEASAAAARAEALTPDGWWVQGIRANRAISQHRWSEVDAILSAVRASTSAPAEVKNEVATYLLMTFGYASEAAQTAQAWQQADPLSMEASNAFQRALEIAGRDSDMQAEYVRSKKLDGDFSESDNLALSRVWRSKNPDPALIKAQFDLVLAQKNLPMALNQTLARNPDDAVAARAAIRQAFDAPENQDNLRMLRIARYAAHYGDRDLALAALHRRFIEMKSTQIFQIWFAYEGNLRTDPRFKTLLRDLGLVDYYRQSGRWPDYCKPVGKDDFECQ